MEELIKQYNLAIYVLTRSAQNGIYLVQQSAYNRLVRDFTDQYKRNSYKRVFTIEEAIDLYTSKNKDGISYYVSLDGNKLLTLDEAMEVNSSGSADDASREAAPPSAAAVVDLQADAASNAAPSEDTIGRLVHRLNLLEAENQN